MSEWLAELGARAARSARPLEGRLLAPGLGRAVEVFTDERGVPHIYAAGRLDLYFAQGFLHAAERLWQVEMMRRTAQGRLAEVLGENGLASDLLYRTIGLGRVARSWTGSADTATRRIVDGYGAGFTAGARALPRPVEHELLAIEPEVPHDFDGWLASVWSIALLWSFQLSTAWDWDLLRCCATEAVGNGSATAVPSSERFLPEAARLIEQLRGAASARAGGSNTWVVSGSRSATGLPLLAADPHVALSVPCAWMEMHLSCPDMDVSGLTIPGIPGVVVGRNRRIAWAFTNSRADVDDLYLEHVSADGASYQYRGEWLPIKLVREEVRVRHEERPRVQEVRLTRHGPLVAPSLGGEAVALRWVHAETVPTLTAVEGMNTAACWEDFRCAASRWAQAGQNVVYADVDGNIATQLMGPVPLRPAESQGALMLPGWTGEHEWRGLVPFDELPWRLNPPEGYVASANHDVATGACRHYLGADWELPHRVDRIRSLLAGGERLEPEDLARLQLDTRSGFAEELLPRLLAALPARPELRDAVERLRVWDLRMDPDSVGASIFAVWTARIVERLVRPRVGDDRYRLLLLVRSPTTSWGYRALREHADEPSMLVAALRDTCATLAAELGPETDGWRWGRLHRFRFDHPIARTIGALSGLLSAGDWPGRGADDTVSRAVFPVMEECGDAVAPTARLVIDLSEPDRSLTVLTPGNSGIPASPHYRDQVETWARGAHGAAPFSRAAVETRSGAPLTLLPPGSATARTAPTS